MHPFTSANMNDKVWFPTSTSQVLFLFPVEILLLSIPGWPKLLPVLHGMSPKFPVWLGGAASVCPALLSKEKKKATKTHLSQEELWESAG